MDENHYTAQLKNVRRNQRGLKKIHSGRRERSWVRVCEILKSKALWLAIQNEAIHEKTVLGSTESRRRNVWPTQRAVYRQRGMTMLIYHRH